MIITLVILALSVTMFIIGRLRSDVVAVCAMAALLIFGVLTPAEALAGFSSTVVIMMVGLLAEPYSKQAWPRLPANAL